MRLYGQITKVTPESDGTVRVEGIASSEAVDEQGEIVSSSAMQAAIPAYMKFPALREMHQLAAAGTTLEAEVGDDGITRIVARVVDPVAILKVKNAVYRGFSIGGRVTKRDAANSKIITGIQLSEISLVDRPANPEAMFECWKASVTKEGITDMPALATLSDTSAGRKLAAVLTEPVQIWHCGAADHQHKVKDEARRCIEKQAAAGANGGTQWEPEPDALAKEAAAEGPAAAEEEPQDALAAGREEPQEAKAAAADAEPEAQPEVPSEAAAKRDEAAEPGEPAEKAGATSDEETDPSAEMPDAEQLSDLSATAEKADGPAAPEPSAAELTVAKAAEIAAAARAALNLGETTAEEDVQNSDKSAPPAAAEPAAPEAAAAGYQANPAHAKAVMVEIWGDDALGKSWPPVVSLADSVLGLDRVTDLLALRTAPDEAVERAVAAVQQAGAAMRELVAVPEEEIGDAELAVLRTKAGGLQAWTTALAAGGFEELAAAVAKAASKHTERNQKLVDKAYECAMQAAAMDGCSKAMGDHLESAGKCMMAAGAKGMDGAEKANLVGELGVIAKAGGHQALLDLAHFCLAAMGTGACAAAKAAGDEKDNLRMAHDHLCAAGASCEAGGAANKADQPEGETTLAKAQSENATLVKSLGDLMDLVPQLVDSNAALNKRLAEMDEKITRIGDTEMPPRGLARTGGVMTMTKAQDNAEPGAVEALNNAEHIVKAVEAMPPSMEKAFLHMRLAHAAPRPLKVVSAAETGAHAS